MFRRIAPACFALLVAGCLSPSALTRNARRVTSRVSPAARAFADGTGRIVGFAGQTADDAVLAARVRAALAMRKGLGGSVISLVCEDGTVWLTGTVRTPNQKRLAIEAARNTVGVRCVKERMKVSSRS